MSTSTHVIMVDPQGGLRGPQRTILTFARHLPTRWDVSVVAPDGQLTRALGETGIEVEPIPSTPRRAVAVTSAGLRFAAFLKGTVARKSDTIIHANGLSALNIVAPSARLLRIPVLVHFHGSEIGTRARWLASAWTMARTQARLVAVSEASRLLVADAIPRMDVSGVLLNPVEPALFGPVERIPAGPFRVGFVGSGRSQKGLDLLVNIAAFLRDEDIEWHLWGVSLNKRMTPYLAHCIQEIEAAGLAARFTWHGWADDVGSAYRTMDALLAPSSRESFGRVLAEGMASGLPVVATRIEGHDEVITHGETGLLFDRGCPEDGAFWVRRLMKDPALRFSLSGRAREAAMRFSVDRLCSELEGWYEGMLSTSGRRRGDLLALG